MLNINKLAEILVLHSLGVKEGDRVLITGTDAIIPFAKAVIPAILALGANVYVDIKHPSLEELVFQYGSPGQINFTPAFFSNKLKDFNKMLNIMSEQNLFYLSGQETEKLKAFYNGKKQYIKTYLNLIEENKLACTTVLYPTTAYAQFSGFSDIQFEKLYNKLCGLYEDYPVEIYKRIEKFNAELIQLLENCNELSIKGPGTDLKMKVTGMKWINSCGKINFPDGEVFTSPVKDSVEGHITISYPVLYKGITLSEVYLVFKKGRLVDFNCSNNSELQKIINVDHGASYLGEIGFGTNHLISEPINNIVFDEKIRGTLHIALGSSYSKCGSGNMSSIHMDMIVDTVNGTSIHIDDCLFLKNRIFHIEES